MIGPISNFARQRLVKIDFRQLVSWSYRMTVIAYLSENLFSEHAEMLYKYQVSVSVSARQSAKVPGLLLGRKSLNSVCTGTVVTSPLSCNSFFKQYSDNFLPVSHIWVHV